jgi:glutamate racemase
VTNRDPRAPIGIFDSGFGGLTVMRAVVDQLPDEDIIYLGDTARAPYGPQPLAYVREFALECLDHLYERGVKMLVIACNTASSAVLHDARERYDVPVVEVITPAASTAAGVTRSGDIGVICTASTARSGAYSDALAAVPDIHLATRSCPQFVEYVERGETSGPEIERVARSYLRPLLERGIDTLILGCTHYPLLTGVISYLMGDGVSLVSSSDACARAVYRKLTDTGLVNDSGEVGSRQFLTTGQPEQFRSIGERLMGKGFIESVEQFL